MLQIYIPKNTEGSYESVIKTEAAINRLFEEILLIPYRFFIEKNSSHPHIHYIILPDFSRTLEINEYPNTENAYGHSKSCYQWSENGFSASVMFEEIWKFGAMPTDGRYNMPEKILTKDITQFHFVLAPEFELHLTVDKKSSTLEVNALGYMQGEIDGFFQRVFEG